MERAKIYMADPVFGPGQAKSALAPIDIDPSGLNCQAELFLGPDENTKVTTSGKIGFVSTGAPQSVRLPVIMPTVGGKAYHVYLDIYAEGFFLIAYQATEDVIIPSGTVGPIVWE